MLAIAKLIKFFLMSHILSYLKFNKMVIMDTILLSMKKYAKVFSGKNSLSLPQKIKCTLCR